MNELIAFEDPNHEGNSAKYHTGKPCVTKGCDKPAGTKWAPSWCFEHNVERIRNITATLEDMAQKAAVHAMIDKAVDDLRSYWVKDRRIMKAMVAAAGGTLVIKDADLDRECVYESVHTPGNGLQTWKVMLK